MKATRATPRNSSLKRILWVVEEILDKGARPASRLVYFTREDARQHARDIRELYGDTINVRVVKYEPELPSFTIWTD